MQRDRNRSSLVARIHIDDYRIDYQSSTKW